MNACPIHSQTRLDLFHRLSRLSGLGLLSCLCFALNLVFFARTFATLRRAEGLDGLALIFILVLVPPAIFALGVFFGALGVSRNRRPSTVAGVALNLLGAAVYLAWVAVVRA